MTAQTKTGARRLQIEHDGSNHTTLSSTTHKLSTTTQTTTGARRLQIEHDGSNHTVSATTHKPELDGSQYKS